MFLYAEVSLVRCFQEEGLGSIVIQDPQLLLDKSIDLSGHSSRMNLRRRKFFHSREFSSRGLDQLLKFVSLLYHFRIIA